MTKINSSRNQTTPSAGWFLHALLSKKESHIILLRKRGKSKLVNQIGLTKKIRKSLWNHQIFNINRSIFKSLINNTVACEIGNS